MNEILRVQLFRDWVPLLEKEKGKRLVQIYPVNIWEKTYMTKREALEMFDKGTQVPLAPRGIF